MHQHTNRICNLNAGTLVKAIVTEPVKTPLHVLCSLIDTIGLKMDLGDVVSGFQTNGC